MDRVTQGAGRSTRLPRALILCILFALPVALVLSFDWAVRGKAVEAAAWLLASYGALASALLWLWAKLAHGGITQMKRGSRAVVSAGILFGVFIAGHFSGAALVLRVLWNGASD